MLLPLENMENLLKEKKKIKVSLGQDHHLFFLGVLKYVQQDALTEMWTSAHSVWNLGGQEQPAEL